MKASTILLLSLLMALDVKADYSMDIFLNFMQEKGYYDIIVEIKFYFGTDVAIAVCKEFVHSDDCGRLVRIYIPNRVRGDNEIIKKIESIIFNPDNYNVYKNNEPNIHKWIEKIKNQYNIE